MDVPQSVGAAPAVPAAEPAISLDPRTTRRNTVVAAALVLLVLLFAFWPAYESGAGLMDEGMILIYPEMLLRGKLPYRDFETFYGPANPAVLAGVFSVFGTDIFVERTIGLIYRMLILVAIFAIVQKWGRTLAVGCVFLTGCLLLPTYICAYAWFGAMVCALWSLWASSKTESLTRCFFGGLLASCALLFRVDVGPAIVLSGLPLFLAMSWSGRWRYLGGAVVGLLPLGLLTVAAGVGPVLDNLFLTPVIHSSPARRLPLFSAEAYLVNLFFAHLLAACVNVVAGFVATRSGEHSGRGRLLLALALLGLGLTHQAAQRLDLIHLLFAAFVSLGILPVSVVTLMAWLGKRRLTTAHVLLAIVSVVAALQAIAPELTVFARRAFGAAFSSRTGATFAEHNGRAFPFHSPNMAAAVTAMVKELDAMSAPGERLFVGPADLRRTNYGDTYLYHMLPKLTPATYFLEMNPISANRPGSRLAADVQTADWLVLNRAWDTWNEPNRSSEYASNEPNEIVRRDFDVAREFGGYLVLRRKGNAPPR